MSPLTESPLTERVSTRIGIEELTTALPHSAGDLAAGVVDARPATLLASASPDQPDRAAAPPPPRPKPALRSRETPLAVVHLAISVAVLNLVVTAVVIAGPSEPKWLLASISATAAVYLAAGTVAWLRRPANQLGAILIWGGFVWVCTNLLDTNIAALVVVGQITARIPLAVIVHVLVAFPSGRVRDRPSRLIVAAAYFIAIGLELPRLAFSTASPPWDVLVIRPDAGLEDAFYQLQRGAGCALMIVTAVVCAARWRAAPRGHRQLLGPLYAFGIFAVLAVPVSFSLVRPALDLDTGKVVAFQLGVLALVPVAFVIGCLRGGFAPTAEIEQLGTWLGADNPDRPTLRDALAHTLGDPSLELLFAAADDAEGNPKFVNADGSPATLPHDDPGTDVAEIAIEQRTVGAIVYDTAAVDDAELVRAAGQVVAIAIDRERLIANMRASAEAVRASRARILDAADAERRRIARDLHDGLQARLLLVGIAADSAGATSLRREVDATLDELGEFVQGIMPSRLIEQGLCAAIEDLAVRMPLPTHVERPDAPIRLTPSVETAAYLVVAEALSNAVKHAGASRLTVRVACAADRVRLEVRDDGAGTATWRAGHGLRGIADRVDALDGRFHMDSRPGMGTCLVTELPCAR